MTKILFESDKLAYYLVTKNNWDFFHMLHASPEVMQYTYSDPHISKEFSEKELEKILNSNDMFCLVRKKQDNTPIWFVWYHTILEHATGWIVEMGYSLMPEYWWRWYGTEMWRSIIEYIFKHTHIHRITGTCNIENIASQKILEKIGMQKEWISRSARYKNNTWIDEVQYAILKKEWHES